MPAGRRRVLAGRWANMLDYGGLLDAGCPSGAAGLPSGAAGFPAGPQAIPAGRRR